MNELIAGIDLGTTNSAIAVVIDGKPRIIDIQGAPTLPSCVGLDPEGRLIVGQAARNQLVAAPDSTLLSIKRRMGEETRVKLGEREFSPEEISACILRELKDQAEKSLGQPINKAVITVPAFFNERQRKATHIAGELAGLEVVRIINEPTAAALAYRGDHDADETILVYDLGGGTFDVSLVVAEQGVVEVKASHGDTQLGGDDFDQLLVNHALMEFQKQHQQDLSDNPTVLRRLKVALEKAKCRMSTEPFAKVREEYLTPDQHLEQEIQRSDYETLILHLIEKTLECVNQSLKDGGLTPKDLDKVMLVGGSTRTPLVHSMLASRLMIEPRWEIDPDTIVALGAAIQGAIIAGQHHESVLVDITPHTFSNAAVSIQGFNENLICVPLIRRNTPLPASRTEQFYTMYDDQDKVLIQAYQGESDNPADNAFIGEFMIEDLTPAPGGTEVVVNFNLDLNGMLQVTATEKRTGKSKTVSMDTRKQGAHLNLDQARANIEALLNSARDIQDAQEVDGDSAPETTPDDAPVELLATAKDLRKRSETLLKNHPAEGDAHEIRELIQQIGTAIKDRDWKSLAGKNDTLSDLLFYLED